MPILTGRKPRPWTIPTGGKGGFSADGYYLGPGSVPLEVAVATVSAKPTESDVRNLWKRRKGNQPSPLLLVVLWPSANSQRATVCGVVGDDPAVYSDRDPDQISRLADLALAEPDHHTAVRFLVAYLPEEAGALRNVALFASHHLTGRVPQRADWADLCQQGAKLVGLRREQLVQALGFTIEAKGQAAILRSAGHARALAMFLDDADNPDLGAARFNGMTPVSWAIASAAADNIPYVIVTRGPQIRVYTTRVGAGSAGKGGTSAFVEISLPMLTAHDAGYLPLLCSAASLAEGGLFETLLAESQDFAAGLGTRLRSRVYDSAVPHIAQALIARHAAAGGDTDDQALAGLYERSLLVLFRLLFVAYAEDRDLLPLRTNGLYRQRSLKHTARDLADLANAYGWEAVPFDTNATDLWDDVRALWSAIDNGRKEWNVPRYNGGMFSSDPAVSPQGAALSDIELTNVEIGPALLGLLVDESDGGAWGPVDFASLDVREFGTIYEGLLESDLALAPCDLTLGKEDAWVPASPEDEIRVTEGAVYLHNKSGARKASGSYFTKPFAVNHLLDHALEPALADHAQRLQQLVASGDDPAVTEAFFDFRCVDLSMGSGHFLVAAVDRIERHLSEFLAEHRISGVLDELARLASAAADNMKDAGLVSEGIDTNTLLRRQIARRCIYGVDLNPTSVELAKLALWIHTFVKGLPLTSLNHGLIVGNSLTGIGTLDEALEVLDPPDATSGQVSLVRHAVETALERARSALLRFAATSEATAAEVREARKAHRDAEEAVQPARMLFDLAVAARIGEATVPITFDVDTLFAAARSTHAAEIAAGLAATHFPVAFPEVFIRERPGFDCILGNPPWEKVKVEEHQWWGLRFPGLRSMPQKDKNAAIARYKRDRKDLFAEYEADVARTDTIKNVLGKGPYPGLRAATDTDLSLAFAWRFWQLLRLDGRAGIVLPRGILSGRAAAQWRTAILENGAFDVTSLINTKYWVFDMEARYTIGLVSIVKGPSHVGQVTMRGPYVSMSEYQEGVRQEPHRLPAADFATWSDGAAFPLLPQADSLDVFLKLRTHPRLDAPGGDWQFVPLRELHMTDNKTMFDFDLAHPTGDLPVLTGASFNLWNPDFGEPYAYAKAAEVIPWLQERRQRQIRLRASAFYGISVEWAANRATLPCLHPRIAFREVTRATDSRTVICALIPPDRLLVHKAPYLLRRRGSEGDEAYLLGVLSSIPLDWYARRYVELSLAYSLLSSFPIPRPEQENPRRQRVIEIAGRLAAVDRRYASWAAEVGVPVGSVPDEATKNDLLAELDALVALLFGLDSSDVEHIFATFHRGWNYQLRLTAVLAHHARWTDAK